MSTFVIALVRTLVPTVVGAVSTWLIALGLDLPDDAYTALSSFLFVAFTGVYYALVRLLEERFPWVGVLLGVAKSPDSYTRGEQPASVRDTASSKTPGPDHRA